MDTGKQDRKDKGPLAEITQPFIDLVHAPRALWGVNLGQFLEGIAYWGILAYLTMYFSDFVFQGVQNPNDYAAKMVMVLTAGITFSMFFLGSVVDKKGIRFAFISSFALLIVGRIIIAAAPTLFGLRPDGLWSPLHLVTMGGILFVVLGYGMFQPSAYAAVKHLTTPKTAAIGFAMIYAVMNLGGWLPSFSFLLRDDDFLGLGFAGVYWVYAIVTIIALVVVIVILSRKTVEEGIAAAKEETKKIHEETANKSKKDTTSPDNEEGNGRSGVNVPLHLWGFAIAIIAAVFFGFSGVWSYLGAGVLALLWVALLLVPKLRQIVANHPLTNGKFFFFIFALIPVQTLFTYNWLVLPPYINRTYEGWIGEYFEVFSNANPALIFILAPVVAALSQKANVYRMMVIGTLVMAAPAFLLVIGPYPWTLGSYIVLMTIGEAMWQPRFLQYAAEIAPKGRTGQYMGVAQFPWFLTKVLVPLIYSGKMMDLYCPADGPKNTEFMWLVFACIAMCSTVMLLLAKGWLGKDFKTKSED